MIEKQSKWIIGDQHFGQTYYCVVELICKILMVAGQERDEFIEGFVQYAEGNLDRKL